MKGERARGYPHSLQEVLRRLTRVGGVEAATIAREDGLVVAHQLPSGVDEKKMAAMAAVLFGAGTRVAEELRRGAVEHCWLQCEIGKVVAYRSPGSTILIALLSEGSNVGLVLMALEKAVQEMAEAIQSLFAVELASPEPD